MPPTQAIHQYTEACRSKDESRAARILETAFSETGWSEIDMQNLAAAIYNERETFPFFEAIGAVSRRYPESVLPAQAFWASVLSMMGRHDDATEEGRHYLAKVKDAGLFSSLDREPSLQIAVGIAWTAAMAAYTELGWRSYSLRILGAALKEPLTVMKQEFLREEKRLLEVELSGPEAALSDARWEIFYKNGTGHAALAELCLEKGYPTMAKRVELLEADLRFGKPVAFETEFFQCVWTGRREDGPYHFLQ